MQIGNENGKSMELYKIKEGMFEERSSFWMELREKYRLNTWVNNERSSANEKALKQALCASLLFLKLIV
jgi:plasmid maintenance system antidote protein VapI